VLVVVVQDVVVWLANLPFDDFFEAADTAVFEAAKL
jgi:hypothetical protein